MDHPDISPADPEGDLKPGISYGQNKHSIGETLQSFRQGAQQGIHRSKSESGQPGGSKLPGGAGDGVHLNRRLIHPPDCRGSS